MIGVTDRAESAPLADQEANLINGVPHKSYHLLVIKIESGSVSNRLDICCEPPHSSSVPGPRL